MQTKQRLAMGILLIAFLSTLLPMGVVQAQDPPQDSGPTCAFQNPLLGQPSTIYGLHELVGGWAGIDQMGGAVRSIFADPNQATVDFAGFDWFYNESLKKWVGGGNGFIILGTGACEGTLFAAWHGDKDTEWIKDPIDPTATLVEAGTSGSSSVDHNHVTFMAREKNYCGIPSSMYVSTRNRGDWWAYDVRDVIEYCGESEAVVNDDQDPEPQVLVEKSYDLNLAHLSDYSCRTNILMTLWAADNNDRKYEKAYKQVPTSFSGGYDLPKGKIWLNGPFGPYTAAAGWIESGGIQGGCACDIISMIAETLDEAGVKVVPGSTTNHDVDGLYAIPGVKDGFSFSVLTSRNVSQLDYKTRDGQDVQVDNPYESARLEWTVDGDILTLWVTRGGATSRSSQPAAKQDDDIASTPSTASATIPWYTQVNWWFLAGILALILLSIWIWRITHPGLQFNKWYRDGKEKREQTIWGRTLWLWWKIWGAIYVAIFIGYVTRLALPQLRELLPNPQGTWELQFTVPNWTIYMTPVVILLVVLVRSAARRARWQPQWLLLPPPEEEELTGRRRWVKWTLVILIVTGIFVFISLTGGEVDAGVTTPTPTPVAPAPVVLADGSCNGNLLSQILASSPYADSVPPSNRQSSLNSVIANITPELEAVYATAERKTGVPCEVLAGIHYVEGNNRSTASLVSGRTIGNPEPDAGGRVFGSLLETAIYAGEHLNSKVDGHIDNAEELITALSRYNGGGNSNCQSGYPYAIPYNGCPRLFYGEDDPYAMNWLDSKHATMYLLYCADYTACAPQVFQRPGSFTVATWFYRGTSQR